MYMLHLINRGIVSSEQSKLQSKSLDFFYKGGGLVDLQSSEAIEPDWHCLIVQFDCQILIPYHVISQIPIR